MTPFGKKLLTGTAILVFGIMLGRLGTGSTKVETKVIEKPVEVQVTHEVVSPYIPLDCRRAIDMAVRVRDAAGKFDTESGPQEDILGKAEKAISEGSVTAVNAVITQQRALRARTLDAADTLHTDLYNYEQILTECKKELTVSDDEGH
jgi:hypothetical protein